MSNHSLDRSANRNNPIVFALLGGLIAATLDIVYAFVFFGFRGVSATRILQSIASGLLGSRAYEGGVSTALLGFALHFALMLIIALIFYLAARRISSLIRHPITIGAVFGILVYWVMNLVVLPLSAFPGTFALDPVIVPAGLLVHAFLIAHRSQCRYVEESPADVPRSLARNVDFTPPGSSTRRTAPRAVLSLRGAAAFNSLEGL